VESNTLDSNWSPVGIESVDGVICSFVLFKQSDFSVYVCKGRYPAVRIPESECHISIRFLFLGIVNWYIRDGIFKSRVLDHIIV
jgi:hypothetical protein